MAVEVLYDDLWSYGTGSIAHVRVVRVDGSSFALAREPLDNPAGSVFDHHAVLRRDLEISYGAVRLLIAQAGVGQRWTDPCELDDDGLIHELADESVWSLVGKHGDAPTGERCRELGGEGHPLLAFVRDEAPVASSLRVVALAALPWPHNPWRCRAHTRFEELALNYPPGAVQAGVVGAHWTATLTAEEVQGCLELGGDWKMAAATAIAIVDAGIPSDRDLITQAIVEAGLTDKTAAACRSLFTAPISWSVGDHRLTNGQHRTCALRAAGATRCIVDLRDGEPPEVKPVPIRKAAAEFVAKYWRQRAAATDAQNRTVLSTLLLAWGCGFGPDISTRASRAGNRAIRIRDHRRRRAARRASG